MRRARSIGAAALVALVVLAACKREPTFDERYAGAKKAISEKAAELETDIARRASEAASDAPIETEATVPAGTSKI